MQIKRTENNMEFEFHYYITGVIAHAAGFSKKDSIIIAHASQLVDDNVFIYTIKNKETGEKYSNYISQTINILKPRKTLMHIYSVFHFIPGDPIAESARRRDGKMHVLNTTPNGNLAKKLMSKAFEKNLYRVGIASHGYTDAWAHQNFVGLNDSFNGFSLNPIPNVCHSDFLLYPDRIGKEWEDCRLIKTKVVNNERFVSAGENLFRMYTSYLNSKVPWKPLKDILLYIMGKDKNKRLTLYAVIAPWLVPYDKYYWLDKATDQRVRWFRDARGKFTSWFRIFTDEYYWKKDIKKEETDWFKFQEAIKNHQAETLPLLWDIHPFKAI